jgi:hypothetical protein
VTSQELTKLGLSTLGTKAMLRERLEKGLREQEMAEAEAAGSDPSTWSLLELSDWLRSKGIAPHGSRAELLACVTAGMQAEASVCPASLHD